MCECCDEVIKRPVKSSAEPTNVRGKPLGIRVVGVAQEPKAARASNATSDEQGRLTVEEIAAG